MSPKPRFLPLILKAAVFFLVILSNFMKLEAFTFNMYSGRGMTPIYQIKQPDGLVLEVPVFSGSARGLMSFREILDPANLRSLAFFTNQKVKTLCSNYSAHSVSLNIPKFETFTC